MQNAEILPATGWSAKALREAMLDSFSDYAIPMQLSQPDFDAMMRQRGLDLPSSRVALIDGTVAAIWLTSVRDGRAYLISSGTRPAYRSRGLARVMAAGSLAYLREVGARSFQTEVLRNNELALPLYLSLGMTKLRKLDCYRITAPVNMPSIDQRVQQVEWKDIAPVVGQLRDWRPSWQNSDASIAAIEEQVLCLAAYDGSDLLGYIIANPANGAFFQLAVRSDVRRQGIGIALLKALQEQAPGIALRFINISREETAFQRLMIRAGAEVTLGQFELYMPL